MKSLDLCSKIPWNKCFFFQKFRQIDGNFIFHQSWCNLLLQNTFLTSNGKNFVNLTEKGCFHEIFAIFCVFTIFRRKFSETNNLIKECSRNILQKVIQFAYINTYPKNIKNPINFMFSSPAFSFSSFLQRLFVYKANNLSSHI